MHNLVELKITIKLNLACVNKSPKLSNSFLLARPLFSYIIGMMKIQKTWYVFAINLN